MNEMRQHCHNTCKDCPLLNYLIEELKSKDNKSDGYYWSTKPYSIQYTSYSKNE